MFLQPPYLSYWFEESQVQLAPYSHTSPAICGVMNETEWAKWEVNG